MTTAGIILITEKTTTFDILMLSESVMNAIYSIAATPQLKVTRRGDIGSLVMGLKLQPVTIFCEEVNGWYSVHTYSLRTIQKCCFR